jgi:hypothetical protein
VDFAERTAGGRALAIIDITDDIFGYQIPLGVAGMAIEQEAVDLL